MLRVWFSFTPLVPSEHGAKVSAALKVHTKDEQHAVVKFLKERKGRSFVDCCLPEMDRTNLKSFLALSVIR
jgi:hypothetical protein